MTNLVQLKNLNCSNIIDINQFENEYRDRPDFTNKYYKLIYFLRFEGIASTLRKYFAHKNAPKRYLTFLTIDFQSSRYINISTQYQTDHNNFVIRNRFYNCIDIDFANVASKLEYYFSKFNQFAGIEEYELFNLDSSNYISLDTLQQSFPQTKGNDGLFIYGLGSYVRMFIIHHFKKITKVACIDYKSEIAEDFKTKYGFQYSFITPDGSFPLLKNIKQPIAIIATYHSDHAAIAYEIFNSNPDTFIFIEKPPIVSLDDLDKLIQLYNKGAKIEIGFNRRFVKYSKYVRHIIQNKKVIVTCSIKEVNLCPNHWYFWKNQGTRITGNVVHWFDLANYWIGSIPAEINLISSPNDQETSSISVLYKNGSILNISASDMGNSLRGVQEKIEIRLDNETIFIDDFLSLTHIKNNGVKFKKLNFFRDKGHNAMYKNFIKIINKEKSSDYSVIDLINTSIVTFYASVMLQNNLRNFRIEDEIEKYSNRANKKLFTPNQETF